jgi:hypothetical protein
MLYKDWKEKQLFLDNFEKILKSGISLSAHSILGWYSQFERMIRFQERAGKSNDEIEILDFTLAFFQNSYHLRDWIPIY